MAYERTNWQPKGASGAPSINAKRLNNIEDGIVEALGKLSIGEVVYSGLFRQNINLGFSPTCVLGADASGTNQFLVTNSSSNKLCRITEEGFQVTFSVDINNNNIGDYFNVSNGDASYWFEWDASTKSFSANNRKSITAPAKTILTALYDMDITFKYGYSTEANYDKYTIKLNDANIISDLSGSGSGTITRTLKKDDILTFSFTKDSGGYPSDEKCYFSNLSILGLTRENVSYVAIK